MGSWLTCRCGALLHTNLFCGTGISVLASEEFLDAPRDGKTLEDFVTEMIVSSRKMLHCKSCERIFVLQFLNGEAHIRSYAPEDKDREQDGTSGDG
jgi:hypothetical protein